MNLMELQRRYGQLREGFAVTLGKHKERILVHLEGKLLIFSLLFFFLVRLQWYAVITN